MWGAAAAVSSPGVVIAAAHSVTEGVDLTSIITGGITPALVVVLFLTGKIVTGKAFDEERTARQLSDQRALEIAERTLPVLAVSNELVNKVAPLLVDRAGS